MLQSHLERAASLTLNPEPLNPLDEPVNAYRRGYSINGQAIEILESGWDGFIQKPFNMKELSQRVREILDKKQF